MPVSDVEEGEAGRDRAALRLEKGGARSARPLRLEEGGLGTPPRDRAAWSGATDSGVRASLEDAANTSLEDAQVYCHGAMTIADLYRLRLCKRSARDCIFRTRLQFPRYVPRSSEIALYGAELGIAAATSHGASRHTQGAKMTMPTGLRPAIQSIYRACDLARVPFSLLINGSCCPGADVSQRGNGSFCRCSIGELGM